MVHVLMEKFIIVLTLATFFLCIERFDPVHSHVVCHVLVWQRRGVVTVTMTSNATPTMMSMEQRSEILTAKIDFEDGYIGYWAYRRIADKFKRGYPLEPFWSSYRLSFRMRMDIRTGLIRLR